GDVFLHGAQHLLCAFDFDALDPGWRRNLHRAAHENDVGSRFARGLCDREPHLSRAAIADEAHRIDALARGACSDDDFQALQDARPASNGEDLLGNACGFDHAPDTHFAAGLLAGIRSEETHAALTQHFYVG